MMERLDAPIRCHRIYAQAGMQPDDALMMEAVHHLTILHQLVQRAVCGKMDRVQMVLLVMQDNQSAENIVAELYKLAQ